MTTETTAGTDQSTATGDAGAGAATTILGGAAADTTGDAGKTDSTDQGEAGKTAGDADKADGKTTGKDGEAGDGKDGKSDADKSTAVPEKYEFSMPDGIELDTVLMEKADPVFRELGLSNEQASKLVQLVAEQRISEGQAQQDAYAQQMENWAKETYSDKELGGSQEAVTANVQKYVPAFLNAYGSPELKALLRDTGLGNHPEIVRVMVRAGKAMAEDGGVAGKSTASTKSAAAVLFDHPTSQHKR